MKNYRLALAASAKADIREAARWISHEISPTAADKWLARLYKTMSTLERQPLRCPLAAEDEKFPEEIRVLLYGRRNKKYRVIFTIRGDEVVILYVRHGARDELEP